MPVSSRRAARRALAGLLLLAGSALAGLVGLVGPAGSASASASAQHADGTHRAPQNLVAAGSAKARVSTIMCTKVAAKAGFSFTKTVSTSLGSQPQLVVAVAVAMAESSCTPHAKNVNDDGGSVDRGLWQLNNRYHPEVSDSCAYQIQCNANAAWKVSGHGAHWSPWSAYNNGSWKTYVSDARAAISGGFTFLLGSQGAGTCLAADHAGHTDGADRAADPTNHADGAKIWQWSCDPADDYQQWTVTSAAGGAPILRNLGSGTCLAWDGARQRVAGVPAGLRLGRRRPAGRVRRYRPAQRGRGGGRAHPERRRHRLPRRRQRRGQREAGDAVGVQQWRPISDVELRERGVRTR